MAVSLESRVPLLDHRLVELWFADELFGAARAILRSPRSLDRGVFHPDRLREEGLPAAVAWPLMNVELWYRIFVDQDPDWVAPAMSLSAAAGDDQSRAEARLLF